MKNYVLAIFALALVSSCQKDTGIENETPITGNVNSFEEMQVTESFDWNLKESFTLQVEGLKNLPYEIQRILEVKDENGRTIFKTTAKMSESKNYAFEAPSKSEYFTINYGSMSKEVVPANGIIDFTFIPEVDNSDLDSDNI